MFKNDLVRIGLVILAGLLLLQLLNRNPSTRLNGSASAEAMYNAPEAQLENEVVNEAVNQMSVEEEEDVVMPETEVLPNSENDSLSDDVSMPTEGFNAPVESGAAVPERPKDCFPKDTLSADDLLPQDKYSKWAEVNPEGAGELKDRNFLEAGWHHGVNTVGQSLRNANYQLRSEPANPQVKVSPWMQSTIGPDVNRKPLEIGGC